MKRFQRVSIFLFLALVIGVSPLYAQKYPAKPVRMIVPYAAGGPVDAVSRFLGYKLSERWGEQLVTDNRGGSGGAVGAGIVVKAPPDGYTLLLGNSGPVSVYPHLRSKPLYDSLRDLKPVTQILSSPMLLVVNNDRPIKTVSDLVKLAKSRPGGLTYASAGIGNLQHLSMELLQSLAGIKMVHVPYKGAAPALVDLMSGQVDLMFANIVGVLPFVKSGKVRAIAISSAKPSSLVPDMPPVAKDYPEFDMTAWMGVLAPAGTPDGLIAFIQRDFVWAVNLPDTKKFLNEQGAEVVAEGPAELSAFVHRESALFERIIRDAGIPKN
jgi:tripartite-type tricarboxylate transporter receptor subunit TctC